MLGIEADYVHFDTDIIIHINTALMALNQLGVGPTTCFSITDATQKWADFIGTRVDIESVKTYIYFKVRLIFDPPATAFVLEAMERQVKEIEWRLYQQVEELLVEEVPVV
jgi:hypothetical protein